MSPATTTGGACATITVSFRSIASGFSSILPSWMIGLVVLFICRVLNSVVNPINDNLIRKCPGGAVSVKLPCSRLETPFT